MSRSGYSDDTDDNWALIRWRGAVASAIRGQRGQAFLEEMLAALDALPVKELCGGAFMYEGEVCALGAVAVARKLEVDPLLTGPDPVHSAADMAALFGIPKALAAEIMFENDDCYYEVQGDQARRFDYMRQWVVRQIEANQKRAEEVKS